MSRKEGTYPVTKVSFPLQSSQNEHLMLTAVSESEICSTAGQWNSLAWQHSSLWLSSPLAVLSSIDYDHWLWVSLWRKQNKFEFLWITNFSRVLHCPSGLWNEKLWCSWKRLCKVSCIFLGVITWRTCLVSFRGNLGIGEGGWGGLSWSHCFYHNLNCFPTWRTFQLWLLWGPEVYNLPGCGYWDYDFMSENFHCKVIEHHQRYSLLPNHDNFFR